MTSVVDCPECGGTTAVKPGYSRPTTTGKARRRWCKSCGCQFNTYQQLGSDAEKVSLIIRSRQAAQKSQVKKMRRQLLIDALWDVRLVGHITAETCQQASRIRAMNKE